MKPDRADLYPDAAYQSEIFCKDSKRERRAEPVRACPNRLLSDAKIVKAERKRELVPNFPRRILSSTKIVKGEGNRTFIRALPSFLIWADGYGPIYFPG